MDELTEYERTRAANIAANAALLAGLNIKDTQDEIAASSSKAQITKVKPVQSRKRKAEKVEETPRRQSRRLRSGATPVNPNETKAQRAKREAEDARLEREAEKEAQRLLESERLAKQPRHQDLDMSVLTEQLEDDERVTWKTTQSVLVESKHPRHVGGLDTSEQGAKIDRAREELIEELRKLVVTSRARVCKDRIYSIAYHPIVTKDLILFGDKCGALGIWDARAVSDEHETDEKNSHDTAEGGQYWRLQTHWPQTPKSSISTIKLDPRDAHTVFTASYDGTLRNTSFVTGISKELMAADEYLLSSIDLSQDGRQLWITDSGGGLRHLDVRERSQTRRWQLTEKEKIGCVSINPVVPHLLLTASNNRTLRMWDERCLRKVEIAVPTGSSDSESNDDNDQAPESTWEEVQHYLGTNNGPQCLWGEWKHRQSVSSAFWDVSGRRIVSTSYDDTLRIWDIRPDALATDGPLKSFRPAHEIKHNCQTGRWLTVLKARWSDNPLAYPHFTVGNMTQSLDIVGYDGQVLAKLTDRERISAVQAVTASHPSILARAVSGNASGRCVLWSPTDI